MTEEIIREAVEAMCSGVKKSAYVEEIEKDGVAYPDGVIQALKRFKRGYRMDRNPDTFKLSMIERLNGMRELVNAFAVFYGEIAPKVEAVNIKMNGNSFWSGYLPESHTITMRGKLSVITLLHEYAHSLGANEHEARRWSINLFKKVYPKAYEKLQMDSANPREFALVEQKA